MLVSLEWLSEYVEIAVPPDELAELLLMSGTSVDRVERIGCAVNGVVVADVVEVRQHPSADNLRVAMVNDGERVRCIVCGAPNLREGMKSALALPGALLPAVSDRPLKRVDIRGVASDGMLLSGAELGVTEDASGILELGSDKPAGTDIAEVITLEDVVFDLEVTPNRPDCMSMVGVAREIAALTGGELRLPGAEVEEAGGSIERLVSITVDDVKGCPRYTARAVTGVHVAPSPVWMQRRLVACGLRPINNVVDITNYVLVELGQPLHAFDLDLLEGRKVIVRLARYGEALTTLDGVERQLDDRSLVIADGDRPVALAGVMGGEDSEVTERSTRILIESAYFDPTSILLTSKRLGLRTEASSRFEKGCDPEGTVLAARRAAALMESLAGGEVASGEIDVYPTPIRPVTIELRPERVRSLLGCELDDAEMLRILESLDMRVTGTEQSAVRVEVPTFRGDLEREIDLVEEIARINGYDRIPPRLPAGGGDTAGLTRRQKLERRICDLFIGQGLSEVISYSFMRPADLELLRIPDGHPSRRAVGLLNPLTETGEVMRTTLLPGLLRVAQGNLNRGNRDLALFEKGRVFIAGESQGLPEEKECLAVLLHGGSRERDWSGPGREVDFFDLKGAIENVAAALNIRGLRFEEEECGFLTPGCSAGLKVDGERMGYAGRVHPLVAEGFGITGACYVAELTLADFLARAKEKSYRPVGRYPNVKVDIAVIVDEELPGGAVEEEIRVSGGDLLRCARLFDVYTGPQIPEGKKSLAYALEFGSQHGTLTDEEAHAGMEGIVRSLEEKFGARLRRRGSEGGAQV